MTRSIMLLKEKPYRPRMADYRIGVFFTGREQLGEGAKTTAPVYYANRWDIQPSDTAAYLRGEKVKPTKQIVFYIDNTFPENGNHICGKESPNGMNYSSRLDSKML